MDIKKLPSNSKELLDELVQADNPAQLLRDRFKGASKKESDELRSILRELHSDGYLDSMWAEGVPYHVTLHNSARTYNEQLAEFEAAQAALTSGKNGKISPTIFISHRSTDKAIAEMLADFFYGTNIPRDAVFCSSLPGNDINEKISGEVKKALKNSAINIAILSHDYYQSAYCLNEAGVLWYMDDIPTIPIALPEITPKNMYGFLNDEYKLRKLDCDTDISYIYDAVCEAMLAQQAKASVITYEAKKLKERYDTFLKSRGAPSELPASLSPAAMVSDITTDDERIVLYYILKKNVRKVSRDVIFDWLRKNEIHDVDVDNAFDLLSTFGDGTITDSTLEFDIEAFRKYSANASLLLPELKICVERHIKVAADTFRGSWASDKLDSKTILFVAYIIDERVSTFGVRWLADSQIKNIKQWEEKHILDSELSNNYNSCLEFFIQHDLVYESSWTSYGNPREYTLYSSLQNLLFNHAEEYAEVLQMTKLIHRVF